MSRHAKANVVSRQHSHDMHAVSTFVSLKQSASLIRVTGKGAGYRLMCSPLSISQFILGRLHAQTASDFETYTECTAWALLWMWYIFMHTHERFKYILIFFPKQCWLQQVKTDQKCWNVFVPGFRTEDFHKSKFPLPYKITFPRIHWKGYFPL